MEQKRSNLVKLLIVTVVMTMMFAMTSLAETREVAMQRKAISNGYEYTYVSSSCNTGDKIYHKIVVPAAGYLEVCGMGTNNYGTSKYGVSVTLLTSKKGVLQPYTGIYTNANDNRTAGYAVKKGTYYILGEPIGQKYAVAAQLTKWGDVSGASKAKAATLTKGKLKNGAFYAGESSSATDWFKLSSTTSTKKLAITMRTMGNGSIKGVMYGPKISSSGLSFYPRTNKVSTFTTTRAVGRGTYYIKLTRDGSSNKKASVVYRLKWAYK